MELRRLAVADLCERPGLGLRERRIEANSERRRSGRGHDDALCPHLDAGRVDGHGAPVPLDCLDRAFEQERRAERRGERLGQPAVPSLDAERVELPEAGAGLGEDGGVEVGGRVRARDLDAGGDRLGRAGGQAERREGVEHGSVERGLAELPDRPGELRARHARAAARLAVAVVRPLAVQPQPQPPRGRVQHLVAREDELGAALRDAAGEGRRPDAPSDAVARLEHDDLGPLAPQRVGGSQAGQAGADDGDPRHECRTLGRCRARFRTDRALAGCPLPP